MSRDVVVIGGGIAGLTAAHALMKDGLKVTLVEATKQLGGKLQTSEVGGIAVDEGAEAFLVRRPEARDLAHALGLDGRLVDARTTKAAVWARGELRAMPDRTVMGLPSDASTLLGVLTRREVSRARLDAWLPGGEIGEDVALGVWARKRLGPAVVDRLIDPLLGGVYAGRADDLSLAATLPQLPRDERSALRAARRAVSAGPASDAPVFQTLRGGLGALPAALAAAIKAGGGRVITGKPVRNLDRTTVGWRLTLGATNDEQVIDVPAVVVATPAAPASRLLASAVPGAAADLATIESASLAIVTTAWHSQDLPKRDLSGYLVPAIYGRPVKAVTFSSAKWPHLRGDGVVVARCSIGRHGDVAELQRDDADLVKDAVAELTTYGGLGGAPVDSRVSRWGGALPQYAVGHRERVMRIRSQVAVTPGLAVCGATYEGVGIPACIGTGQMAACQIESYLTNRESR
jgi:oxygen-dependent protoporphyrinogen oxidase